MVVLVLGSLRPSVPSQAGTVPRDCPHGVRMSLMRFQINANTLGSQKLC